MFLLSSSLQTEQNQMLGGPGFNSIPALRRSIRSSDAGMCCSAGEKTEIGAVFRKVVNRLCPAVTGYLWDVNPSVLRGLCSGLCY